jgi:hypothetical protein
VSEFTIQSIIVKLEDLRQYEFPFTRLKHVLGEPTDKKKEEATVEEVTDEEAKKIEKENEIIESKVKEDEDPTEKLLSGGGTIDLSKIDEGEDKKPNEEEGSRRLLQGFSHAKVKIYLVSDELEKLYSKQKF